MADNDFRPSISDPHPLFRHVYCLRCARETWYKQDGHPHRWVCEECGLAFQQNPWVTDDHPFVDEPEYEEREGLEWLRAKPAKELAPVSSATERHSAQRAEDGATTTGYAATTARARASAPRVRAPATVSPVMVQANFL